MPKREHREVTCAKKNAMMAKQVECECQRCICCGRLAMESGTDA